MKRVAPLLAGLLAGLLLAPAALAAPAAPRPWWKDATVYQIYPRSFADSNGDGIGDLNGITARLDYLKALGVDTVWLSPHFPSPNVDNGYDISDYRGVMAEFGTMADFDRMLAGMKARGIRLIIDLVVNHTSDRHPWFEQARQGPGNRYRDYYIWRPGKGGGPPNNDPAFFGGSAWTRADPRGDYYLHYFAPQQPDLNWDNPVVRREVRDIMRFWLDKGVSGFRMDVIPFISKDPSFPDLTPGQLKAPERVYAKGPRVHDYLHELNREVLSRYDAMTVGEAWGVTAADGPLFTDARRGELNMVFQFDVSNLGRDGWRTKAWTVPELKAALGRVAGAAGAHGWAANFLGNHDAPRALSHYGDDRPAFRVASAKALATLLLAQRGTAFVYQGDELGMRNYPFTGIDQFRDISARNNWARQVETGKVTPAAMLAGLNGTSRDHGRTPMQWSAAPGAGFTTGTPWIGINPDHATVNAAAEERDAGSVLAYYKAMIALRRADPVLRDGSARDLDPAHPSVYLFERALGRDRRIVAINLSSEPVRYTLPKGVVPGKRLIGDATASAGTVTFAPWQAAIWRVR